MHILFQYALTCLQYEYTHIAITMYVRTSMYLCREMKYLFVRELTERCLYIYPFPDFVKKQDFAFFDIALSTLLADSRCSPP